MRRICSCPVIPFRYSVPRYSVPANLFMSPYSVRRREMKTLIFIDTNILLDFYRSRGDVSLHLLDLIEKNLSSIITSNQVEMEFKNNRQAVIMDAFGQLKQPKMEHQIPAVFRDAKTVAALSKSIKKANEYIGRLRSRTLEMLARPTVRDPVFRKVQHLFKNASPLNLRRDNERRYTIRRLARKRFMLGYPPRKRDDVTIGDAVNWEWIIDCAEQESANVIIVSRDTDYGVIDDKKGYLNDWLLHEFHERIGRKNNARLTPLLTDAFKSANVKVSKEEIKVEKHNWIRQFLENIDRGNKQVRDSRGVDPTDVILPDYADLGPDDGPPGDDGPPDIDGPPVDDGPPDIGGPPDVDGQPFDDGPPDVDVPLV